MRERSCDYGMRFFMRGRGEGSDEEIACKFVTNMHMNCCDNKSNANPLSAPIEVTIH